VDSSDTSLFDDDLIAMKRHADRDRDRDDVNQLLAIQRLRDES
jgi:hypothetical protein